MSAKPKALTRFQWRVRIILGCLALLSILLITRLYFVQVVYGAEYRAAAEGQYTSTSAATEARGDIYFTEKNGRAFAAAVMRSGYKIAIQPNVLENPEKVYAILNEVTPIARERFFAAAAKKDDPYEEVATRVDEEAGRKIRDLELVGVVVPHDRWRFYPAQARAAQTLGFVGFQGHERVGRYGLERYWEDTLKRNPHELYGNFFADIFANIEGLGATTSAEGGDIVTTIEPTVVQRLEDVLADIDNTYTPRLSGGIVMDPKTGAIIAMSATPSFDPNKYNEVSSPAVFSNPLVESVFELGSIMKPLTVAAGIDAGVISSGTVYNDTGCITRSEFRVCNFDHVARGRVPMQEVLSQSLNTGATFVAEQLGFARFAQYVRAYGLGEETGIDVPNEVRGKLAGLDSGSAVDLASASFGQGIALTPIAMTRALAALANGGVLPEPHVVDRVVYPSGLSKQTWHMGETRVISEAAAEETTRMLVEVVDSALLKGKVKQEGYSIAAKTGTAQIAQPGGGYSADKYLHSFFGYFPAHDPQFVIFLFTVEPKNVQYASQTLTEPFMDLAKFLISYYDIPPDR